MGDWGLRGQDLDQRYAKFDRAPMSEEEQWNLGKASIVEPGIGCALYLTKVSCVPLLAERIKEWAIAAAKAACSPRYKGKWGKRITVPARFKNTHARDQAGFDGVWLGMFEARFGAIPSLRERAERFQVDREAYGRVRESVRTDTINKIVEFRYALEWAFNYVRDRGYDGKLKTANSDERDTFKWDAEEIPNYNLASGCALTLPAPASDSVEAWLE